MDKFIKEKLDKLNIKESEDIVVPNTSACKSKISAQLEANRVKKRRLIFGYSMGGLATVATIIIVLLSLILTQGITYTDKDLMAYQVSVEELRNQYGLLAISDADNSYIAKESYVYKHKDTGVAVYSKIVYVKGGDTMELRVVFVDNYDVIDDSQFSNLDREFRDSRFTGNYTVTNDTLHAKLINNSKQYYINVVMEECDNENGDFPSGVTIDLESLLSLFD